MKTAPIRFLQLNTNRSNSVCHTALNKLVKVADVILLNEPWFGQIGHNVRGPANHPAWVPILPTSHLPDDIIPRVMAYVQRRHDFTVTLRSDLASDADMQILEITQPPNPPTIVVNIYNQRSNTQPRQWTFDRLTTNVSLPTDVPVILSGDMNTHHPLWEGKGTNPTSRAKSMIDWLDNQHFQMLNDPGVPTYFAYSGRSSSVLDLTFLNVAALRLDTVREWALDHNCSFGSDHAALRWKIDYGEQPIDNPCGQKYLWKKADEKRWKDALTCELDIRQAALSCLSADNVDAVELNAAAEALTDAMQEATEQAVPIRRNSPQARPWWNNELDDIVQRLHRLRDRARLHVCVYHTTDEETLREVRQTKRSLQRQIRRYKKDWINSTLEEANDPWSFAKWGRGCRNYPTPAIRQRDGTTAINHAAKCEALRSELFQPPPNLPGVTFPDLEEPSPQDIPWIPFTRGETRNTVYAASPSKAPGPSQMTNKAVRWV